MGKKVRPPKINKITLSGRMGNTPEIFFAKTSAKALVRFSLAVDSSYYSTKNDEYIKETTWIKIVAWGSLAETIKEKGYSGALVYLEGSIKSRKYSRQDGSKGESIEITCHHIQFLEYEYSETESAEIKKEK